VGVVLRVAVGDRVEAGQPLAVVHARSDEAAAAATQRLRELVDVTHTPVAAPPTILARLATGEGA